MKNTCDRIAPSAEIVIAAVRRFETEGHLYSVTRSGEGDSATWTVTLKADNTRKYRVFLNPFAPDTAFPMTCTCPAHEKGGYCKHCAMVESYEAIETAADDYEHRHEAEYAGRY